LIGAGGGFFDLSSSVPGSSRFLPGQPILFPLIGRIDVLPGDPHRNKDLNLTAFDGHISRGRTIFPAFFHRSV